MSPHDEPDTNADVVYLPHARLNHDQPTESEQQPAGEVIEGELVTEAEYKRLTSEKDKALDRWSGYRADVVTVARTARTVATHQHTKTTARAVTRHVLYVPAGVAAVTRRAWEAKSNSRYERMMRAAEAAGDLERLADWETRAEQAKQRRHDRIMNWIKAPTQLAKAAAIGAASVVGILLGLGVLLAVSSGDPSAVLDPIRGMLQLVHWIAVAVTVAWGPLMLAAPWVTLLWLWNEGRKRADSTAWLQPFRGTKTDVSTVVTPEGIVKALGKLGITELSRALTRDEWRPMFEVPPISDGKGYRTVFELPLGVTPNDVANKRDRLARNLNRTEMEVWPSDYGKLRNGKAGFVDLWVANPGVLNEPVPEYPLLHEGIADVFTGVPMGISQRGETVVFPLVGSNFVFGGQPGQGKSNAVRALMLGAALDPIAELRMHVFAMNGDFDAYSERFSRYEKGVGDEHIQQAVEHLRELHAEVGRREDRLAELGAKKLSRGIAEKHPDMRPLVVGFSECHEMFGNKDLGEEATDIADDLIKRGRKTGVIAGFDTQSARKGALPPKIVENIGINGCFAVKSWRNNDGFLGDGSFAAGIRATDLRFNVDLGTMITTGVSEALFEIVRTYYIPADDDTGWDAATEVIARAMANLDSATPTAADRPDPAEQPEQRELLADLDEVLDTEIVPAADAVGALQTLAPSWAPYKQLDKKKLATQLAEYGVKVPSTNNRYPIDPTTVRAALAERATTDLDEET